MTRNQTRPQQTRVALIRARWHAEIVDEAAVAFADEIGRLSQGTVAVDLFDVPGAFEIPLVASRMARSGRYDAVICLGAVIRGETTHFELVATEAARGIAQVALETGVPVIFEVLATDDLGQAESRAGGAHGNKGWEAAAAALEMAWLLDRLPEEEGARP